MLKGDEDKAKNYMNVAVDLDPKNYKLSQKDPLFMPIRKEIHKPEEVEKQEDEKIEKENEKELNSLTKNKEKKVYYHLFKTNLLIENLSNEDLRMIKNKMKKQKAKEFEQKEKGQE